MSSAPIDPGIARRIAENESRFRDANEKIEKAAQRLEPDAPSVPFVCECGRPDCFQTLRLTIVEYELARENPRYFVCVPGHEFTDGGLGRLVRETSGFVVAEKTGVAGAVAEERDPRQEEEIERTG
jgi:hypothetical protein